MRGVFLKLGLNFIPSGLYTVMYIDPTWKLQLLLFGPGEGGYLCCKEMIINNVPGCVGARLPVEGAFFCSS